MNNAAAALFRFRPAAVSYVLLYVIIFVCVKSGHGIMGRVHLWKQGLIKNASRCGTGNGLFQKRVIYNAVWVCVNACTKTLLIGRLIPSQSESDRPITHTLPAHRLLCPSHRPILTSPARVCVCVCVQMVWFVNVVWMRICVCLRATLILHGNLFK